MVRPRRQWLRHVLSLVMVLGLIGILAGYASSEPTSTVEESCLAAGADTSDTCSFSAVEVPDAEDDSRDLEEQIPKDMDEYEYEYEYVDTDDEEDQDHDHDEEDDEEDQDEDKDEAEANTVPIGWGKPQVVEGENSEMTLKVMDETWQYMTQKVFVEDEFKLIRRVCTNDNELCSLWAVLGKLLLLLFGVECSDRRKQGDVSRWVPTGLRFCSHITTNDFSQQLQWGWGDKDPSSKNHQQHVANY